MKETRVSLYKLLLFLQRLCVCVRVCVCVQITKFWCISPLQSGWEIFLHSSAQIFINKQCLSSAHLCVTLCYFEKCWAILTNPGWFSFLFLIGCGACAETENQKDESVHPVWFCFYTSDQAGAALNSSVITPECGKERSGDWRLVQYFSFACHCMSFGWSGLPAWWEKFL